MECRLGRTRLFFSFGFFAVLALYMLLDRTGVGLPAILAVVVHESGHILMMHLVGAQIESMRFCPFGVRLERRGLLGIRQETMIYLGGVLLNALAVVLWVPFYGWTLFALVNAALFCFNLLPVGRLDGGQLLRLALYRHGAQYADSLRKWIGFFLLTPLFAAAFLLLPKGNLTLLATAVYLAITLLRD